MSANQKQVSGVHYKDKAIQPWDFISANNIPYLEGNVIKYVSRWREKNGISDLEKAKHYLEKLIEVEKSREPEIVFDAAGMFKIQKPAAITEETWDTKGLFK